jgi:hypothetical protein
MAGGLVAADSTEDFGQDIKLCISCAQEIEVPYFPF